MTLRMWLVIKMKDTFLYKLIEYSLITLFLIASIVFVLTFYFTFTIIPSFLIWYLINLFFEYNFLSVWISTTLIFFLLVQYDKYNDKIKKEKGVLNGKFD